MGGKENGKKKLKHEKRGRVDEGERGLRVKCRERK